MEGKEIHNHFEKDSNCQVFQGPISGCVFAMPGSVVTLKGEGQETPDKGPEGADDVMLKLGSVIRSLALVGKQGRDLIAPYVAAYELEMVRKMTWDEFNAAFGTEVKQSTYSKWTTAVFRGYNDSNTYSPQELSAYKKMFEKG